MEVLVLPTYLHEQIKLSGPAILQIFSLLSGEGVFDCKNFTARHSRSEELQLAPLFFVSKLSCGVHIRFWNSEVHIYVENFLPCRH